MFQFIEHPVESLTRQKHCAGWQATKLLVRPEVSYDYVAQGKWRVDVGDEVTADGRPNGTGRLVGNDILKRLSRRSAV